MNRRRPALLIAAGLALPALAGCVVVPTSGAVHQADSSPSASPPPEATFVPRGPVPGQRAAQVVDGFFAAMLASPMSASVARRFLTDDDAAGWAPERGYLTYASRTVTGHGTHLRVLLSGVNRFDDRGGWVRSVDGVRRLRLAVRSTPDGLRLTGVPDALVVSDDWFEQQTDPLSVAYFDPDARQLVAEPVFVPRGAQRATLLVHALLAGPADPGVERSFIPPGTRLNLSVTLRRDGTAEVPLTGRFAGLDAKSVERMVAQFAATLRQVPEVTAVRLLVDGRPLPVVGDQADFDVTAGSNYDLSGLYPAGRLFGLRDGVVVKMADGEVAPVDGPWGSRARGVRDVAVAVGADQAAGVTTDGSRLLVGAVGPSAADPVAVLSGRTDLTRPTWDVAGRLWVADRTDAGAVVYVVDEGRATVVDVPGVTGRRVRRLLVSSDGTRLAAVVRRRDSDRVVLSRVGPATDDGGAPLASRAVPIAIAAGAAGRVHDLAWSSPTELAALVTTVPSYVELDSALVDGSPVGLDATQTPETYAPDVDDLVSSGRADEPSYVGAGGAGYVAIGANGQSVPDDVRALTYVG